MATMDVKDATGATVTIEKPLAAGRAAAASSRPVVLSNEDKAALGAGKSATHTDKSGTITSGGAAQTIAAINANRTGFFIQNVSTGDLWLSSIGTAAASQPSIWLPPGSFFELPSTGVPTTAISLYGATTGQAFAAREW